MSTCCLHVVYMLSTCRLHVAYKSQSLTHLYTLKASKTCLEINDFHVSSSSEKNDFSGCLHVQKGLISGARNGVISASSWTDARQRLSITHEIVNVHVLRVLKREAESAFHRSCAVRGTLESVQFHSVTGFRYFNSAIAELRRLN